DNKNNLKFDYAKCNNIVLKEDINDNKKNSLLDNVCDCELIDGNIDNITCPPGKYLRTYYPLLKKALCCIPCSSDGKIKGTFENKNCFSLFKNKNDYDLNCPSENYVKSLSITGNTNKIECCGVKLEGEKVEQQKKVNN